MLELDRCDELALLEHGVALRLLAGQAELLTRLMPALAALMAAEAVRCPHVPSGTRYIANGARHPSGYGGPLPAFPAGHEGG